MRFVFFDNDTRLLFATACDGDWDTYIDDFLTKIPVRRFDPIVIKKGRPGDRPLSSARGDRCHIASKRLREWQQKRRSQVRRLQPRSWIGSLGLSFLLRWESPTILALRRCRVMVKIKTLPLYAPAREATANKRTPRQRERPGCSVSSQGTGECGCDKPYYAEH